MERPALKRLLEDIKASKVQIRSLVLRPDIASFWKASQKPHNDWIDLRRNCSGASIMASGAFFRRRRFIGSIRLAPASMPRNPMSPSARARRRRTASRRASQCR